MTSKSVPQRYVASVRDQHQQLSASCACRAPSASLHPTHTHNCNHLDNSTDSCGNELTRPETRAQQRRT